MTEAALLARVVLAAVFALSAIAKLRDRPGSRQAVSDFGVPQALAPAVATALPWLELLCAALLITADPGATAGALGAGALLAAFTIGITVNLVQGKRPDCHCFGQLGGSRIGWPSVARNVVLMALAGLALAGNGASVPRAIIEYDGRQTAIGAAVLLAAALLTAMSVVLFHLLTRYGAVLLRLEALERAAGIAPRPEAPSFELPDLDGDVVTLAEVLAEDRPALLVFVSPGCDNCSELLPDLERWQTDPQHRLSVVVISDGDVMANREKLSKTPNLRLLRQGRWEVANAYGVEGTPAAVLIGADGTVISEVAYAVARIQRLHDETVEQLEQALGGHDHHDHTHHDENPLAAPGNPLPDVAITTENGEHRTVGDVAPDGSVLLFWRTDCSFCEAITGEIGRLQEQADLLLVTGTPTEEVRASGLRSPILRERYDELTDALGVPGTPSAVRIRGGTIDSHVAVGGPAVIALIAETASLSLDPR